MYNTTQMTQRNKRNFSILSRAGSALHREDVTTVVGIVARKEGQPTENSVAITTGRLPSSQQPDCCCHRNSHADITVETDTTGLTCFTSSRSRLTPQNHETIPFAGHVMRMAPERPARRAIEWTPADGRRKKGRPRNTWRSTVREDLQARGVSWSEKETMAADRVRWRNLLPIVPQGTRGSKC